MFGKVKQRRKEPSESVRGPGLTSRTKTRLTNQANESGLTSSDLVQNDYIPNSRVYNTPKIFSPSRFNSWTTMSSEVSEVPTPLEEEESSADSTPIPPVRENNSPLSVEQNEGDNEEEEGVYRRGGITNYRIDDLHPPLDEYDIFPVDELIPPYKARLHKHVDLISFDPRFAPVLRVNKSLVKNEIFLQQGILELEKLNLVPETINLWHIHHVDDKEYDKIIPDLIVDSQSEYQQIDQQQRILDLQYGGNENVSLSNEEQETQHAIYLSLLEGSSSQTNVANSYEGFRYNASSSSESFSQSQMSLLRTQASQGDRENYLSSPQEDINRSQILNEYQGLNESSEYYLDNRQEIQPRQDFSQTSKDRGHERVFEGYGFHDNDRDWELMMPRDREGGSRMYEGQSDRYQGHPMEQVREFTERDLIEPHEEIRRFRKDQKQKQKSRAQERLNRESEVESQRLQRENQRLIREDERRVTQTQRELEHYQHQKELELVRRRDLRLQEECERALALQKRMRKEKRRKEAEERLVKESERQRKLERERGIQQELKRQQEQRQQEFERRREHNRVEAQTQEMKQPYIHHDQHEPGLHRERESNSSVHHYRQLCRQEPQSSQVPSQRVQAASNYKGFRYNASSNQTSVGLSVLNVHM